MPKESLDDYVVLRSRKIVGIVRVKLKESYPVTDWRECSDVLLHDVPRNDTQIQRLLL